MYYHQPNGRPSQMVQPYLMEVKGEGEVSVQPNLATINLGVVTEGKEVIETQQKNTTEMTNVINSILSMGILENKIQTFDYRIDSQYDFDQGKQIFRGYKVTHLIQIKMEDLSIVGKVIDNAVKNGANYVSNVQFTLKNKEAAYQQALTAAINDTRQKAQTIAESLKVQLFPIPIHIQEGIENMRPLLIDQPVTFVKGISTTRFEPGELVVKANVSAKFHYSH